MPKLNPDEYLPVESYQRSLEAVHTLAHALLLEFAVQDLVLQDRIARNFIARADMLARAVFRLWEMQDYTDCWVLNRCLYDRLFHIWHLGQHGDFEEFQEWSFRQKYLALESVRSDPEMADARNSPLLHVTPEQRERARMLGRNHPAWKRPKAADCAKKMKMPFLYRYGYDFASAHVHPMADDGLQDFYTTTGLQPAPDFRDQRSVLSNTIAITTMTMHEALNVSTLRWRAIVYDCLDGIIRFLDRGDDTFVVSLHKVLALFSREERLCRPVDSPEQSEA